MISTSWRAGLALGVASLFAATTALADESDYATDYSGRRLRVTFDPGRRLHAGVSHAPALEGGAIDARRASIDGGMSYRHVVDFPEEDIRWKLHHDFVTAGVVLGEPLPEVRGELYSLTFLRWSRDGGIVLPTSPPRRLDVPFGVGFELGAGRLEMKTAGAAHGEIGVARGALLVDLLPRRTPGTFVTLGAGPRYDVRVDARSATAAVDHVIVPFSQPELALRTESADGHHLVAARGGGGYAWSQAQGAIAGARASVRWETIVAAVNDLPVSVGAELRWRWDTPARAGFGAHDLAACWGMRVGMPLD